MKASTFSLLKGKDAERLKAFPSLAPIYAHRNLAFIGPAGTGKTHLAQTFGYACCTQGLKTYFFIKASELRYRFTAARRSGKADSRLTSLVRPSCLIVGEMEACKQRFKTKYIRLPDLLLDLEIARTENNYRETLMKYATPRLLILDEWLLLKPTEMEQHDILELLHARRKKSSTIFCSQYHDSG